VRVADVFDDPDTLLDVVNRQQPISLIYGKAGYEKTGAPKHGFASTGLFGTIHLRLLDASATLCRMERQYPPFGQIPGPVFGQHRLSARTADTLLSIGNFRAYPSGLLACLHTVTRDGRLFDVSYSFEPQRVAGPRQLDVWARYEGGWLPGGSAVAPEVASVSRNKDSGIEARSYELWFAIDPQRAADAVTVAASWPEASIRTATVTLPAADLRLAAVLAMEL